MKYALMTGLVLLMVSTVHATLISVDADGYGNGTDISTAFAGVTLSTVGGYSGLDGAVYAWADGLASTPTAVFANNLSFQRQWYANDTGAFALRADFDQLANSVAIDIIGDNPSGSDYGVLFAYDSAGTLLDFDTSSQLEYGQIFRAEINRTSFDIAYIIAGGSSDTSDTVHLDNLTAYIPEPATLCLLALGGLIAIRKQRK